MCQQYKHLAELQVINHVSNTWVNVCLRLHPTPAHVVPLSTKLNYIFQICWSPKFLQYTLGCFVSEKYKAANLGTRSQTTMIDKDILLRQSDKVILIIHSGG